MKEKIILLFGGPSEERFVSVASAQNMAESLKLENIWFWHKNGEVYQINYIDLIAHKNPFTTEFIPKNSFIYSNIKQAVKDNNDNVFLLALHGGNGENGWLQKILEEYNTSYTGSDSQSSHNAFDKLITKKILKDYRVLMAPDEKASVSNMQSFFDTHGPFIIKPSCAGSSFGCYKIINKKDIDNIANKINFTQEYMLEKLLIGTELSVGVIQTQKGLKALCPTEVVLDTNRDFDYEAKYLNAGSKEITPARINLELAKKAQDLALSAHKALNLYGYSRTDMISVDNNLYFLEVNTLPGLTKNSFIPQQLAYENISMKDFLKEQITWAKERKPHCHR
jgi:D-alanine-D-alanine ligase